MSGTTVFPVTQYIPLGREVEIRPTDHSALMFLRHVSTGTTYNLSITESGNATDSNVNFLTALNTLQENGSAGDVVTNVLSALNVLTESGSATDSTDPPGSVYTVPLSEAGSVTDSVAGGFVFLNSLTESGSASDSPSNTLTAVNTVSEAGSASDSTDPPGSTYNVPVTEAGLATDTLAADGGLGNQSGSALLMLFHHRLH